MKAQVEFNPRLVAAYRLIGYENRLLRPRDFDDETKDAGDLGAGHAVTALYEIVPAAQPAGASNVELKYQRPAALSEAAKSDELLTLKLRYKAPDRETSEPTLSFTLASSDRDFAQASADFRFAAAVAGFGLMLRDSAFKGNLTYAGVLELAQAALGDDPPAHRSEFVHLVRLAKALSQEER